MEPLRIGLIGPGEIADKQLIPALGKVPDAKFWSVMSRDLGRAHAFALKHGAASPVPAHADIDSFLRDPSLDAVIIATPDRLHAGQGIAAMRAGKHVLVEKPMAVNAGDAAMMAAVARQEGVRLGVAYHHRWHAGHRLLKQALAGGALGKLRHVRIHWSYEAEDASNWRASSDAGRWWRLAALGTHCLDLVRWTMVPACGEVTNARGLFSDAKFGSGRDETALALLRFADGATAEVLVSVAMPQERIIEVRGDGGIARCDWTLGAKGVGSITINGEPLAFDAKNPYVGELVDFVAAVREGRDPEVNGEEGAKNVALMCLVDDDAKP